MLSVTRTMTEGTLISLDALTRVLDADPATGRVRVEGGIRLHALSRELHARGLAMENLGDIDAQSIAGAISTGTHGTGTRRQGIAAAVSGLTLVLADGSTLECSAEVAPEVFAAAGVGLGALGVVTEVELQCVPAFRLHARESAVSLTDLTRHPVLADLAALVDARRSAELVPPS